MKNFLKIVSIIGLTTMVQTAYTAEITDTYNTGDTLNAATLETIKSAVNDNNARSVTGSSFGDMRVWDGTAWVLIPVPSAQYEATLHVCGGLPTFDVCLYAIGDPGPAGGIVFYVTDGGAHGLETAPADTPTDFQWGCSATDLRGAGAGAIGTGAHNTIEIVAGCPDADSAGIYAANYALNGYSDWFLPSSLELYQLYLEKATVDPTGLVGTYWSSSEVAFGSALLVNFSNNPFPQNAFKGGAHTVRVIRAF